MAKIKKDAKYKVIKPDLPKTFGQKKTLQGVTINGVLVEFGEIVVAGNVKEGIKTGKPYKTVDITMLEDMKVEEIPEKKKTETKTETKNS